MLTRGVRLFSGQWLAEEADQRLQGTVKEVVSQRFGREAAHLRPLPTQRYDTSYLELRQVSWDSYIDVRGNRYSVPAAYAGRSVVVRIGLDGTLRIYAGEELLTTHALTPAQQGWVTVAEHLAPLWRAALSSALQVEQRPPDALRGGLDMELNALLEKLKLEHLEAQLDSRCEQAAQRELDYKSFLTQALGVEWQGRHLRSIESRLRLAHLPWLKTVEQFDFSFQPSLESRQVRELAGLGFVERAQNVVILGPPGVGKTHLAVALAIKAVEAGYSAQFLSLESLMTKLVRAKHENRLERTLQQLVYPKLPIIDEIGYLPLSREEASLFFRLIVRRYKRASLIVTSNKSFLDWGEVFNDHVLATAILDRLLHHATMLNIKGESYRLKEKRKAGLLGAQRPTPEPTQEELTPEPQLREGP